VTSEGEKAYRAFVDPEAFNKEAVRLYRQWKIAQPSDVGDEEPEEETPGKAASITLEQAEEQAWSEIDQYLRTINPYEFQEIVASLLRAMGYHVSWIAHSDVRTTQHYVRATELNKRAVVEAALLDHNLATRKRKQADIVAVSA
jgi:restriction endonuclease Mrr